jgi:hypothetical protein
MRNNKKKTATTKLFQARFIYSGKIYNHQYHSKTRKQVITMITQTFPGAFIVSCFHFGGRRNAKG